MSKDILNSDDLSTITANVSQLCGAIIDVVDLMFKSAPCDEFGRLLLIRTGAKLAKDEAERMFDLLPQ